MPYVDVFPYSKPEAQTRVICVALDESKYAEAAFNWCLKHLCRNSAESNGLIDEIVLLHVRQLPLKLSTSLGDDMIPDATVYSNEEYVNWANQQSLVGSQELLKKYGNRLMDLNKGVVIRCVSLTGDPRAELVDAAKNLKAEMMVVGTRGMGLIRKAMIGSVSDHLLHHLECPVIVVRAEQA
ncbi:adenine nucleotide alpha hydrolases-like protein [Rhizoclosmatium globosum]|uniref:Adenine nucleotide alpha hydrolases-like protein n=1 Tax=Rhizoclosmatium globosum TaxID=329046 RepID=A0A1Y2CNP5_9FUNG|nr:adenine nucleotide alpha hydrolases-like protein [Rhizoclosmatium globosum]|eukprot:ORY48613.1 adenine nucleotide alpha hydrolases-like protein [Rhizoclosmatium globosum]